jgi:hypothetical protein
MDEVITLDNLDEVVRKNRLIRADLQQKAILVRTNWNNMQISDSSGLAMHILRMYGLIQLPIDNNNWNGAIFIREDKKIPVINTAQPRANQYYTAWMEIYHLIFDSVLIESVIEARTALKDRKAAYFASMMLFGNLMDYYNTLANLDFVSKVFHCMDTFKVPYRAVLIALYEDAMVNRNSYLMEQVKNNFDVHLTSLDKRFRAIGLDDSLVKPSYVVNVNALSSKIQDKIRREPNVKYHEEDMLELENIVRELRKI